VLFGISVLDITLDLIEGEAMRALLIFVVLFASLDALADVKSGEKKAQLCLLCHKPGSGPLLEAQPSKYLVVTTTAFKTGKRPSGPYMTTNVERLSARDIKDIADYFASRPSVAGVNATDPAKVAAGEIRVAEMKCAACHGATFAGAEMVPRVAGQTTGYLIRRMEAFAAGRSAHPSIETPFNEMTDVEAIANYFTSLK
jgi:cytochrome c553